LVYAANMNTLLAGRLAPEIRKIMLESFPNKPETALPLFPLPRAENRYGDCLRLELEIKQRSPNVVNAYIDMTAWYAWWDSYQRGFFKERLVRINFGIKEGDLGPVRA
jgi:hypothetical protein